MNLKSQARSGLRRVAVASCLVGASLAGWLPTAKAELAVVEQHSDAGTLTVFQLSITPAAEPVPALRHRLAVRQIELKPGNAVTHYLRAFPEGGIETAIRRLVDIYGDEFHDWYRADAIPLSQLPLEKVQDVAATFDSDIENFIAPATTRRECDWGLGIEEMRGPGIVAVVLPEFSASRSISRILALRTRVAIAQGDYNKALRELRMNYRLAKNVGSEPLLVCSLIGIAEASTANQQVIELIAAKNSPNLYWAIAELPQPLVDLRKAVEFEMSLGLRIFPFLNDAETTNRSSAEWARLFSEALAEFGQLTDFGSDTIGGSRELRQAAVAGLSTIVYPHAKQRLIQEGMSPERVAAMPVGQVIAIDAVRQYRHVADEMQKWVYVPYHVARKHGRERGYQFDTSGPATVTRGYGYILASLLLPAVDAAKSAEARLDWQTRALQVVEAVRMHAAEAGALPTSLDQITAVPVPINPATNEPYHYHLDGQTAVLELPFSDGFAGVAWRFEITLVDTK